MEQMAKEFEGQAHFLFIYVREAHPGELYPTLKSMEQKFAHARDFRAYGVKRDILIDSLYGRVHRRYGGVSNMTYIVDHTGHIVYRAAWTVADDIKAALEETLDMAARRRDGRNVSTYYREQMGIHNSGPNQQFLGGKQAEEDFKRGRANAAKK